MKRNIEIYKLPSGLEVRLYAEMFTKEKEAIQKDLVKVNVNNPKMSDEALIKKTVLKHLLVDKVDIDNMSVSESEFLYNIAFTKYNPDPNALAELKPRLEQVTV